MSLKKFLILPLLISLSLFIYFSDEVANSVHRISNRLDFSWNLVTIIIAAVVLQIAGHVIRAKKAEYLFRPVKDNTTRFQFRALSIGYLFNTLLPFRLGELIRARIIAGGLDLSFSFSLAMIIVERALDAAILGLLGLLTLLALSVTTAGLLAYCLVLLVVVVLVACLVTILTGGNSRLLKWFYHFTALFRETIKHSSRFKVWSVIYGLQRTLTYRRLVNYAGLSLLSWLLYGISVLVLVQYFFPDISAGEKLLAVLAPYFGLAIPSGPASLGTFSDIANAFTRSLNFSAGDTLTFNLVAWAVLILPISLIGIVLLFVKTKETLWRHAPRQASAASLENKLRRTEDISQEMSRFLENYFSGNTLSHIVHNLELSNEFKLLRYFKGGSDAITILASQDGEEVVKKIIPPEFEDRLKAQHDWLSARRGMEGIVEVLREYKTPDYYAIDLKYQSDDEMLFDFMHHNPLTKSQKVMDEVWGYLSKHVHGKPGKLQAHTKERQQYIDKHIYGCLEKAAKVDPELLRAAQPEKLIINGHEYDNLYQVMKKIEKHPQAWKDIATYKETPNVHGDVAVDNILVSQKDGHALLIDPAPDGNIINGPVFDFGKNMQALYCGYEFLLRDEDPVYLTDGNVINYRSHSSAQYTQLCDYVREKLAPKYLSEAEQRSIIFHAAALHIRRLKHQVYYNPANSLKFYAVGVKTLNDFLAQYEKA